MKLFRYAAPALALLVLSAGHARAQNQTVSMQVTAINQLSFSGSPSLVINTATAGSAPTSATANATYAITTNESGKTITAQLTSAMPDKVHLFVLLDAPSGATPASNPVELDEATAHPVVTGIGPVNASGLNITYTLSAGVDAGAVAATSRTVTYTITAGS